jgi:phytoene dehydrogenase-like protein
MGGVNGHRGLWGFVRGGMGTVSNAIAESARSRGVTIRTSAPVEKILVRDGHARGVVLKGGEEIQARIVASNLDPRRTFLQLMDPGDLPEDFLDGIRKFRSEGTSLKMNLALSGLPEFKALEAIQGCTGATCHLPVGRYIERA